MSSTNAIPAPSVAPRLRLAARVVAAVLGGYAFTWGFIAAATAGLFKAGMDFHDAEFLSSALGLLVFLAAFLWSIASRRHVGWVWLVLAGGAALMAGAGSLLQASIV